MEQESLLSGTKQREQYDGKNQEIEGSYNKLDQGSYNTSSTTASSGSSSKNNNNGGGWYMLIANFILFLSWFIVWILVCQLIWKQIIFITSTGQEEEEEEHDDDNNNNYNDTSTTTTTLTSSLQSSSSSSVVYMFCIDYMTPILRRVLLLNYWEVLNSVLGYTKSNPIYVFIFVTARVCIEYYITPLLQASSSNGGGGCIQYCHLYTVLCWSLGDTIRCGCFFLTTLVLMIYNNDNNTTKENKMNRNNDNNKEEAESHHSISLTLQQQNQEEEEKKKNRIIHDQQQSAMITSINTIKYIRYTMGPILFPLGVIGEICMLARAAMTVSTTTTTTAASYYCYSILLWIVVLLWPFGFYPLMIQLLKQRQKFIASISLVDSSR